MNPYTVILLYPDHSTDNYGQDTYCTSVEAPDPEMAVRLARAQCVFDNDWEDDYVDLDDLFAIAIFAGAHDDLNPGI